MSSIGNRIHKARLAQNMSVDDLSRKLGKNRATIYRYESDEIENFPFTVIEPLAKALNVSPAYLMGWNTEEPLTTDNLRSDERQLLSNYNCLNKRGQKKVLEDTHNLTLLAAYAKAFKKDTPEYLLPKAAHERTDIEVTEEMRRHDDELMRFF